MSRQPRSVYSKWNTKVGAVKPRRYEMIGTEKAGR